MNQAREITVTLTIGEGRKTLMALDRALTDPTTSPPDLPTLKRARQAIEAALRAQLRGGDASPGGRG